jgi:hypothetical protein
MWLNILERDNLQLKLNKKGINAILDSEEYFDSVGKYVFGYRHGLDFITKEDYIVFYGVIEKVLKEIKGLGIKQGLNGYTVHTRGKTITVITYKDSIIGYDVQSFDVHYRVNFYKQAETYTVNLLNPQKREVLGGVVALG